MPVTGVNKDPDALTVTITADFDADAERIWELWADPRQLERWWGPPNFPATFVEHDLSVGARTTYFVAGAEGEKFEGRWRVVEVERPNRLRIDDDDVDAEGKPTDGGPTGMTVTIAENAGTTTMSIETHFADREALEQMSEGGMEQGMTEALAQIDGLLAG